MLVFYPADFTPGCTREACSIRDLHRELTQELHALVIDYWHDVDTNWGHNAPGYYTEDGVFEGTQNTYKGRDKIRVNRNERKRLRGCERHRRAGRGRRRRPVGRRRRPGRRRRRRGRDQRALAPAPPQGG